MRRPDRRAACARHIGGRSEQQDNAACFVSRDGRVHLLVAADGMGGHRGGELASRVVIEIADRLWQGLRDLPDAPAEMLETLCQQAHAEIRRRGKEQGLDPHSTLAAVLVTPERAWWVHVGDTRVHAFRGGRLVWRTDDHTVVQQLIRSGRLSEPEGIDHPERNKLLRGLGGDEPVRGTHGQLQMTSDTGFVLCTDGFWSSVGVDEMARLLDDDDPVAACERGVKLAAERGGAEGDNVTVAVLRPSGGALGYRHLWPLFGAFGVAALILLVQFFR